MIKILMKIVIITFLSTILVSSLSISGEKGKGHDKKRPPGWEKGEKEGWQSDKPPGLEKKNLQDKQKAKKSKTKQQKDKSKPDVESELTKHDDHFKDDTEATKSALEKENKNVKSDSKTKVKSKKKKSDETRQ